MKRRLLLLLSLLAVAAAGLLWAAHDFVSAYRGYAGSQLFVVEPGEHAARVARRLVSQGVLKRRLPFLLGYCIGRPRHALRAGEYMFDRPLRPFDVYRKLVQGDVYLHPVIIPEGSDCFDIARLLNQKLGIDPALFLRVAQQAGAIRDLDPRAPSLEGYLFPDTYRFARGVSAATAALTMLARFRHIVATRLGNQRPPLPGGWHAVITLASLVEKETPETVERPIIAGVFARRLEKGMPLQCDPTVVYAARLDHRPAGPIAESDLQFDSLYNTYRYTGLPPGPIANPGLASIRAALLPAAGEALYFVANNHGGHVFARTLAEHQHNVARYRRELAALRGNQAGAASGKPKAAAPVAPAAKAEGQREKGGAKATRRAAQAQKRGKQTQQKGRHP